MKRKVLGKGLSALLPDPDPAPAAGEVPIESLEPNPYQPRTGIEPQALAGLAQSIRESGIVQPILVRPHGRGYQIIAGERRWRAARQAGLDRVPVSVRDVPDDQLLELALVENIQRAELSPVEEAQAYHRLQEEFGLTQEQVALKVGKDRSTVANTMRLLRLPAEIRALMDGGQLDAGHARALLALDDGQGRLELAREAARRSLSVREVERRVALLRAPPRAAPRRDPNTRAAEEKLRAALGTRVRISRRGRGGVVRIAFGSESELQRLFEVLVRAGRGRG
ncbi:MAG TPA: ParB/RepB/Spo0J family partition protein [Vicinamibacteria bacterium]|nr:ParB/RepB/Spo0J family partition protein [Vicinamibacteria bacterium]